MAALAPRAQLAARTLPFLSGEAGRGVASVTAILGQIFSLAGKTPEEPLSGNGCGAGLWGAGVALWGFPPLSQGGGWCWGEALLAAVAVTPPLAGDFICDTAACYRVWGVGGCGGPQGSPTWHPTAQALHPRGAGARSGSAQGLAADTSRGPSKLSHALLSWWRCSRGEHPGWRLRRGLRPSSLTPNCGGWRDPQSRVCPVKALLGMLGMLGRRAQEGNAI